MISFIHRPTSASDASETSEACSMPPTCHSAPCELQNYGKDHLTQSPSALELTRRISVTPTLHKPAERLASLLERHPAALDCQNPFEKLLQRWKRCCFLSRDVPDPDQVPAVLALVLERTAAQRIAAQLTMCDAQSQTSFMFALAVVALESQKTQHAAAIPVQASVCYERYQSLRACLESYPAHPVAQHALALLKTRDLVVSGQWSEPLLRAIRGHCQAMRVCRAPGMDLCRLEGALCDADAAICQVERELAGLPEAAAYFRTLTP